MKRQRNPNRSAGQKPRHSYQRIPETLHDHEIKPLLQEALKHCHRDYTLILFTLLTGLRNTEVLGLNVENITPYGEVTKVLDLPWQIAKGNKPRSINLNDEIRSDLSIYLKEETLLKRITDGKSPLFRSRRSNKRLGPRGFQLMLRMHAINSIKRNIYPHMLRHTFATKLLSRSNIKIVQDILGHSSLQSTQVYLHPSSSEKAEAVNKLTFA